MQQANVITESTRFHAQAVVSSLEAMSDTITSFTLSSGYEWPYVTVPHFDKRGSRAREDAYIEIVGFSPLVTYEDREEWVDYSLNSSTSWDTSVFDMIPFIWKEPEESSEGGEIVKIPDDNILMAPMWQTSPKANHKGALNYNLFSETLYQHLYGAMTESKKTALSAVYTNNIQTKLWGKLEHAQYHNVSLEETRDIPHSALITPVYDSFDPETRNLAGLVHGILPWDTYLTDLLPPGVNGIVAVLANSCGQRFTFRIDGPKAIFVGEGE